MIAQTYYDPALGGGRLALADPAATARRSEQLV
jgi:hypothetical protein